MFNRIKILVILIGFFQISSAISQDLEKDANANFKDFYLHLALQQYLELCEDDSNNTEFNYRIGFCYLNLELDKSLALPFLLKARNNNYDESSLLLDIGLAYFYNSQFDLAIETLQTFRLKEKDKALIKLADNYINYATNAKELTKRPLNVTFLNLGEYVNSEEADYNPYYNDMEKILYYTTNRRYNSTYKVYINNVYFTIFDGNGWKRSKNAGSKINSTEDEILTGIADNNECLFIKLMRFDIYNDTYKVNLDGNKIREMMPLGENVNTKDAESGATLSVTGDTLIFASDRSGGFGGLDLYMSLRLPDGSWGEVQNLGNEINTSYNEDYPNLEDNSRVLYFASEGHNSMGGYDIFRADLDRKNSEWDKPENIGFPINTVYNDKSISFDKDKRYAFKSDIKSSGFGSSDIYQIVFNNRDQVYTLFKGKVYASDKDSLYPVTNLHKSLFLLVNNSFSDELIGKYRIDDQTGEYLIALPPGQYDVKLTNDNYKKKKKHFIISEMNSSKIHIRRDIEFTSYEDE